MEISGAAWATVAFVSGRITAIAESGCLQIQTPSVSRVPRNIQNSVQLGRTPQNGGGVIGTATMDFGDWINQRQQQIIGY
jgi:hypothetical protein